MHDIVSLLGEQEGAKETDCGFFCIIISAMSVYLMNFKVFYSLTTMKYTTNSKQKHIRPNLN